MIVALIGKHASFEFSGDLRQAAAQPIESATGEIMSAQSSANQQSSPIAVIVLAVLLIAASGTAAVFATLYFTSRSNPIAQNPEPKKEGKQEEKKPALEDNKVLEKSQPKLAEFHKAVLAGQVPLAAELLKDVDVDEWDEQGRTALMNVAAKGNIRMTMFLLAMGAQLTQRDKGDGTALMYAAENGQTVVMDIFHGRGNANDEIGALRAEYRLKKGTAASVGNHLFDHNARDKHGRTAFMRAVLKSQIEAAKMLTYNTTDDTNLADAKGNTLVHLLAADGNAVIIKSLKINGTPDYGWHWQLPWYGRYSGGEFQTNHAGQTAWMLAAEKGHLDIVKHLLAKATLDELDRKDKVGKTGLDLATANKHAEVVAYLSRVREELKSKAEETDRDKKDK